LEEEEDEGQINKEVKDHLDDGLNDLQQKIKVEMLLLADKYGIQIKNNDIGKFMRNLYSKGHLANISLIT
jgi:hypothetical protein